MDTTATNARLVLIATALVAAVLGSIHAFSVFLVPLQSTFELSRATVSLTYSFGLVALTLAVTFGPALYGRLPPWVLLLAACTLAAAGAFAASRATGITGIWLGYSLAFGAANGLGYGFGLQFAALAIPDRKGWAMGVVTAAYAFGAALSPLVFTRAVAAGGFSAAMEILALSLVIIGVVAALLIRKSNTRYINKTQETQSDAPLSSHILTLWIAYGAGVSAGLMAIGHAAALAEARGFNGWTAPAVLAVCNLSGSLIAGLMIDRLPPRHLLPGLALL